MEESIEELIADVALRVRILRMYRQEAIASAGGLTDRETFLLQIIGVNKSMRVGEICKLFPGVSDATISTAITKLWKENKFVNKAINPENQREITVTLTPEGEKALEETKRENNEVYKNIRDAMELSIKEEEVFRKLLKRATEYFDKLRPISKTAYAR